MKFLKLALWLPVALVILAVPKLLPRRPGKDTPWKYRM
jgi:hypothetical protein